MILKKHLALFFMIFFMMIISAPTIIVSIDNSHDTSILFDLNEEEEKDGVKLLFELSSSDMECAFIDFTKSNEANYTIKKYSRPDLNLVLPPPDLS